MVGDERPDCCTGTIYIKNRTHPVRVTEFYKEWPLGATRTLEANAAAHAAA